MKFILFAILSYLFYRMFVTPLLSSLTGQDSSNPSNIRNPKQKSSDDEYLDYEEVE